MSIDVGDLVEVRETKEEGVVMDIWEGPSFAQYDVYIRNIDGNRTYYRDELVRKHTNKLLKRDAKWKRIK